MTGDIMSVLQSLAAHGVAGAFAIALFEKLIPVVPAIILYGLIGASAAEGTTPLPALVIATATGSAAGSAFWHLAMRRATSRLRTIFQLRFRLKPEGVLGRFSRAAGTVRGAAFAQFLPGVRFGVALMASDRSASLSRFMVGTFLGASVWSGVFLGIGWQLTDAIFG